MLWNNFDRDIEELHNQFDNTDYSGCEGIPFEELRNTSLQMASDMEGQPHSMIKARIMDYVLDNMRISIYPKDWFGIKVDVMKVSGTWDAGKRYYTPMQAVCGVWKDQMKERYCPLYASQHIEDAKREGLYILYPDFDHSTPNWENALNKGFSGLLEDVENTWVKWKKKGISEAQELYYSTVSCMLKAMIRFIGRAAKAALEKVDEDEKMPIMYQTLVNLTTAPPKTCYEVMMFQYLYWLIQENVECTRVRTLGGLDSLYYSYYLNDVSSGRYTPAQISELFKYFFNQFYCMHVMYQQPAYLGGQDASGKCIVNDLSRLIIRTYDEMNTYDPKLQVRVSEDTPDDFLKMVLACIRKGNSSISLINDDVAIKALMKVGATLEEARTYLVSGCWDYTVKDHETKTIPIRINMPKALELCMHRGIDPRSSIKLGVDVGGCGDFKTFDEFYHAYKAEMEALINETITVSREFEPYLSFINPTFLFSATRPESVAQGKDAYQDGSKYNNTVINPHGLATVVDSLAMVKKYVYDRKCVTLKELVSILDENWIGHEDLRQEILDDGDKFGNESDLANSIAADLCHFLSSKINNVPNARGGVYKAGLITIDFHVRHGQFTGATPDGRLAYSAISKNVGPSVGMDRKGITACLNSITCIDFTDFSHAAMVDAILHPGTVGGDDGLNVMLGILRAFMREGGHSIQFNVFDPQTLRDAQKHPEKYQTLQVRVCGWNVFFVNLSKWEQDIFIAQAEHVAVTV